MEITSSKNNITNNNNKMITTSITSDVSNDREDEEMKDVAPPGFRFHPTDEELIGFYLRRKIDNKPLTIRLIKQIDIYKYDPWDLPKASYSVGDKEWYFFCKRGRKYKNSIRPNRVTGSGFWKATGIDKPVHSNLANNYVGSDHHQQLLLNHHHHQHRCIGLKKTLVYYRGSAGKGTKTDWMMHEFRLPSTQDHNSSPKIPLHSKTTINHDPQEAEIWTLCRIFKRNAAYKFSPDWKELSATKLHLVDATSKKCNNNIVESNINRREGYIDFSAPININEEHEKKPAALNHAMINDGNIEQYNLHHVNQFMNSSRAMHPISVDSFSCSSYDPQDNDFFTYGNWDELRSVVDFALNPNDHL